MTNEEAIIDIRENIQPIVGGNPAKCDFYPEVREKAHRQTQEYKDAKELEFYRWWITKHNLNVEVATAFERWLNEQKV